MSNGHFKGIGKLRTSVRYGESKTSKPDRGMPESGEGLAGGEEEVAGDRVWRGGKLNEGVSERMQVSEAGGSGDGFWKEDDLKQQDRCQHECFQPDDPRPSGMMGNESETSTITQISNAPDN